MKLSAMFITSCKHQDFFTSEGGSKFPHQHHRKSLRCLSSCEISLDNLDLTYREIFSRKQIFSPGITAVYILTTRTSLKLEQLRKLATFRTAEMQEGAKK
jgi:hypothetical protein